MQDLDRDLAIMFFVVRQVHGRHSAAAQLALDGVVGECTLNRFEPLSHFVRAPVRPEATDSSHAPQSSGLASSGRRAERAPDQQNGQLFKSKIPSLLTKRA